MADLRPDPSSDDPAIDPGRLRALLEINNAVVQHLDREDLVRAVCRALARVLPVDSTAINLYDPEIDAVRVYALDGADLDRFRIGTPPPIDHLHGGPPFDFRSGLLRRDLAIEQEYGFDKLMLEDGLRSCCVVPVVAHGHAVGTLGVGSTQPNQYSDADMAFLRQAAGQVALAVANMLAHEEIRTLKARLEVENVYLQEEIRAEHNFEEIVGRSPALLETLRKVGQVAPTDSTVLILGETGTGKELIARAIHDRSRRRARPLVKVNCAAISSGLVESELFGHVKGAFTGALANRDGRFAVADRGTIFLDEVGELPLETQAKLLRVLQEHEFEPVGSSRVVRVDVRVIAATNRDLAAAVQAGTCRADLYYRLAVFPLAVPALRERTGDLPLLVTFLVHRYAQRFGKRVTRVPDDVLARLARYPWPGNVRELQNVIERAVILSPADVLVLGPDFAPPDPIPAEDPKATALDTTAPKPASPASLEDAQRRHIEAVLDRTGWRIEGDHGAAEVLGLQPSTLRSRMRKLGITRR